MHFVLLYENINKTVTKSASKVDLTETERQPDKKKKSRKVDTESLGYTCRN